MLNGNAPEKFTSCGDEEAEILLKSVLSEMREKLCSTGLSVYLGGSYGRGDGGVRLDRENGILYNDLDFFVFARTSSVSAEKLLKDIARSYEEKLKVDVDFSRIMTIGDIKKNAPRLMMQELKRGYRLVCGEDLLETYLSANPAEKLPFSEACRLLLNRGMGLLLAGEKIAAQSSEYDFILRNINKAILGACDALLLAEWQYKWRITERLEWVKNSGLSDNCKKLYASAVEFKKSPAREVPQDLKSSWLDARALVRECVEKICGVSCEEMYCRCLKSGEVSLKNFIKYCIKTRTLPLAEMRRYSMDPAAVLAREVYRELDGSLPENISNSKLYQRWLIFN